MENVQSNQPQNQNAPPPDKLSPGDIATLVTFFVLILGILCWKFFNPQFLLYAFIAGGISGLSLVWWQVATKRPSLLLGWLKGGIRKVANHEKDGSGKQDVYISYDSADVMWKDWIAYTLEQAGYSVIPESMKDDGFIDHMHDGDKLAKYKMIIWSPAYSNKLGNNHRHHKELMQQKHGRRKCLQVVVHLDGELKGLRVIELTGILDESEARERLLEGVRKRLGKRNFISNNSKARKPIFPGSNWNISNPTFTDEYQDKTLNDLYSVFIGANEQNRLTKPQALTGLAKMGKTEIASLYAYQNRSHYIYGFQINALDRKCLVEKFKHIARVVKPKYPNGQEIEIFDLNGDLCVSEEQLIDAIRRWLEDTRNVLLILDRCDNLDENEIGRFLPRQARSHILLTTCSPMSRAIADRIEINGLTPLAGANLLLKLAGKNKEDGDYGENFNDAKLLSEKVGGIPTALIAMGKEIGGTVQNYMKIFATVQEHGRILREEHLADRWLSQLQCVQQANHNAPLLLMFCAFLNSNSIPVELISQGASATVPTLSFLEDIMTLNEAIRNLRHYSLIRPYEEKIYRRDGTELTVDLLSVNPMLQLWLKEFKLPNYGERSTMAEQVVKAVAYTFPDVTDPLAKFYACHDEQCYELITKYQMAFSEAAGLLEKLSVYFTEDVHKAQKYLQEALAIRKKIAGDQL